MLLVAVLFGFFMITTVADKLRFSSWPATRAVVLGLETHTKPKSSDQCVQLRYRYLVGGKEFVANRMTVARAGSCYRDQAALAALTQRYRPGTQIWIRYDPAHPHKAAIHPDKPGFIDVLFCLLAILLGAAGVRLLKHPAQQTVGCHS